MRLFHGSNVEIDEIDLAKSLTNKDFGCGFYLSDDEEQAKKMAIFKTLTKGGVPTLNVFEFDQNNMCDPSLKILTFKSYSLEWAQFVLANRQNSSRNQIHEYDIVYGPIADDRVGAQIRRLENGDINIDEFMRRIKYMKGVTFQYFFGTEKAVSKLKKL